MDPTELATAGEMGSLDLHVHTTMSDGSLSLAEVVEVAAALGVQVGIADHISSRNRVQFISTDERLSDYLEALRLAPVFRSGELCWCDAFARGLTPELLASFDYLIGSNHGFALPDGTMGSPWWQTLPEPWAADPHRLMDIMVANLCDLAASMPVAIVAHPTLLPPALLGLEADVHAWWTEEREDRLIDAVTRSGVALEISNRYRLPHDRLLSKAKQAGARFSLGSDGHQRHQVARLDWAVQAAQRAGIGNADLFVPERKPRI